MSDWIGPNIYRIESFADKTKHISLSGDLSTIHLWTTNAWNRWEFVYLGIGKSGKDEYHLIDAHSGKYMAAQEKVAGQGVSCMVLPPRDNRVRWHVIPTRSGSGTYWITSVADPKLKLTNSYHKTDNGTKIDPWDNKLDVKTCCWYLRLADEASLPYPDLGKATV